MILIKPQGLNWGCMVYECFAVTYTMFNLVAHFLSKTSHSWIIHIFPQFMFLHPSHVTTCFTGMPLFMPCFNFLLLSGDFPHTIKSALSTAKLSTLAKKAEAPWHLRECDRWVGRWTQRSKVLGSMLSTSYYEKCQANFSCHATAFVYSAVIGTWRKEKKLIQMAHFSFWFLSLHKIATIHQVATMLAISRNHWPPLKITGARAIIKVSGHHHRWLVDGYDLEIGHF